MKQYRGADGWINEDGKEPRRFKSREDTKPKPKANKPEPTKPAKAVRPNLDRCPNCTFGVSWKRVEGYCGHCGWGKKSSDWDDWDPPITAGASGDGALACCGMVGASIIACLVGMGMGYGVGGWAGLLIGLGLGALLPVGLLFLMHSATSKKE